MSSYIAITMPGAGEPRVSKTQSCFQRIHSVVVATDKKTKMMTEHQENNEPIQREEIP